MEASSKAWQVSASHVNTAYRKSPNKHTKRGRLTSWSSHSLLTLLKADVESWNSLNYTGLQNATNKGIQGMRLNFILKIRVTKEQHLHVTVLIWTWGLNTFHCKWFEMQKTHGLTATFSVYLVGASLAWRPVVSHQQLMETLEDSSWVAWQDKFSGFPGGSVNIIHMIWTGRACTILGGCDTVL